MKKIFKKFQVKDFVFLAVLSAAMTLCGGITMPLVMHTTVFGLRNMAAAPIYSIFVAIGLMKVRKPCSHNYRTFFGRTADFLFDGYVF